MGCLRFWIHFQTKTNILRCKDAKMKSNMTVKYQVFKHVTSKYQAQGDILFYSLLPEEKL